MTQLFAIPSPEECPGVAGVGLGLVGLTVGVAGLLLFDASPVAWAVLVAGLLVTWLSFLYCVVWAETERGEEVVEA